MKSKNQDLFVKLNLDKKDNPHLIFSRTNYFFKNYDLFIKSLLSNNLQNEEVINKIFQISKPVHYATFISAHDLQKYKNFFLKHEYQLNQNFNSVIIQRYLRTKYQDNHISAKIQKMKHCSNKEIEIFYIENGLDTEEIENENKLLRHFAIEIDQNNYQKLERLIIANDFQHVIGGSNDFEKSTINYYEKIFDNNDRIRLELFVKN